MAVDLKNHPGLNPDYFRLMKARLQAQAHNRTQRDLAARKLPHLPFMTVPKQPNKYVPHTGAKQRARGSK